MQGSSIVGAIATIGIGVIVVAAIYQLNQAPNVTNATTNIVDNTLGGLFK
jgi:hypothetical protein